MSAFAWYNVIFYIPLAIGLLLALGAAFGVAEMHHGIDTDHDGAPDDHGGEHDQEEQSLLSMIGVGRVPLLVLLMTMTLVFGGVGVVANMMLAPILRVGILYVGASVLAATTAAIASARFISRTVARVMPTTETHTIQKSDLVGCTGKVTTGCSGSGRAQVYDSKKNLHQIEVVWDAMKFSLPRDVLIIEYRPEDDIYVVEPAPREAL